MKVDICTAEKEGFISAYMLRFENGLILRTVGDRLLWGGEKEREEAKKEFTEVVDALEKAGFDLGGISLRNL